jgi:hypothetical protein
VHSVAVSGAHAVAHIPYRAAHARPDVGADCGAIRGAHSAANRGTVRLANSWAEPVSINLADSNADRLSNNFAHHLARGVSEHIAHCVTFGGPVCFPDPAADGTSHDLAHAVAIDKCADATPNHCADSIADGVPNRVSNVLANGKSDPITHIVADHNVANALADRIANSVTDAVCSRRVLERHHGELRDLHRARHVYGAGRAHLCIVQPVVKLLQR